MMFGTISQKRKFAFSGPSSLKAHQAYAYELTPHSMSPEHVSKYFLKGFLAYLAGLYSDGEISEAAYHALVNKAVSLYAEGMTVQKLEHMLPRYEMYLEKVSEGFL